MKIFLIRHGQSMANLDPTLHATMADHAIPLSPRGEEQATQTGVLLKEHLKQLFSEGETSATLAASRHPHIRLWNSPYKRTRQTADLLQEAAGDWITDRREHVLLCEQQFGLFEGVPDEELPKRFPEAYAHYKKSIDFDGKFWARVPQGESRFDVATRVHQSFGSLQRDKLYENISHHVVVCHGVTLRAFVMMWCRLSPEWFEQEPNPYNCAIRVIENTHDRGYLSEGFPPEESSYQDRGENLP